MPAGSSPNLGRVLTNACGENERVEPAQRRGKRSELASNPVDEEVDDFSCGRRLARQQDSHIAGNARDAKEPRTLVDQLLNRLSICNTAIIKTPAKPDNATVGVRATLSSPIARLIRQRSCLSPANA